MIWNSRLSAFGSAWSATFVIWSFAGNSPVPWPVVYAVAAVTVLPGFITAIIGLVRDPERRTRRSWFRILNLLPWPDRAVAAAVFFGFWLVAFTATVGSGGVPGAHDGIYTLDNHGVSTTIDEASYHRHLSQQNRGLIAPLGAFGAAGAAICGAVARRRDSTEATAPV